MEEAATSSSPQGACKNPDAVEMLNRSRRGSKRGAQELSQYTNEAEAVLVAALGRTPCAIIASERSGVFCRTFDLNDEMEEEEEEAQDDDDSDGDVADESSPKTAAVTAAATTSQRPPLFSRADSPTGSTYDGSSVTRMSYEDLPSTTRSRISSTGSACTTNSINARTSSEPQSGSDGADMSFNFNLSPDSASLRRQSDTPSPDRALGRIHDNMRTRTRIKTQTLAHESRTATPDRSAVPRPDTTTTILNSLPSYTTICADLPHLEVNTALIGIGATSRVYAATDRVSRIPLAVKVTSRFFGQEENTKLRQLGSHPNLVHLYDVIERDHTSVSSSGPSPPISPSCTTPAPAAKRSRSFHNASPTSRLTGGGGTGGAGGTSHATPVWTPCMSLATSPKLGPFLSPNVAMMEDPLASASHLLLPQLLGSGSSTPSDSRPPVASLAVRRTSVGSIVAAAGPSRSRAGSTAGLTASCSAASVSHASAPQSPQLQPSRPPLHTASSPLSSASAASASLLMIPDIDGMTPTTVRRTLLSPSCSPRALVRRIANTSSFRSSLSPSSFGTPLAPVHARRQAAFATDMRTPGRITYLVLERMSGALEDVIVEHQRERKPLSNHLIQHIVRGVARALQHLHQHNIVMNDVSPENIMFTEISTASEILNDSAALTHTSLSPTTASTATAVAAAASLPLGAELILTPVRSQNAPAQPPPPSPMTLTCRAFEATQLEEAEEEEEEEEQQQQPPESEMQRQLLQTTVKLIDLGNAMPAGEVVGMKWIHPRLRAPELAWVSSQQHATLARTYEPPVDLWALGIVLAEMLLGRRPFDYGRELNLTQEHIKFDLHRLLTRDLQTVRHLYPAAVALVHELLVWNAADRLTCGQLLQHSFLQ